MAVAIVCYLALTALILGSAAAYLVRHPGIASEWWTAVFAARMPETAGAESAASFAWLWPWMGVVLWSFPQMALGLSGFEMIMTVVPGVSSTGNDDDAPAGRIRNTRKLMLVAASIMAVYLVSAVAVTTLLIPAAKLTPGGAAEHRALAYLAHGGQIEDDRDVALNPLFGENFGDLYDMSTVVVLCLAGATVTMGLRNLLPHYLNRLGMEVSWAGKVGVILHVLNAVVLLVTVVFRASPSSQQWAYATSVLVLLTGAAIAATIDLARPLARSFLRTFRLAHSTGVAVFFLTMTVLTVLINQSGLTIALSFVVAILLSSIVSRWIRSTELRFEGFDFADDATHRRWRELCCSGPKVLAPHRPGLIPLAERSRALQRDYRLDPATQVIFIEAALGDPSNFYQKPLMKIETDQGLEVIRVSQCVSVSHVLAAICLELCREGAPPEIIFGWSHETPLAANLNFLLLGEGNIPWMVKELVRKAMCKNPRQPRIIIG
jgi:hypothetical protein